MRFAGRPLVAGACIAAVIAGNITVRSGGPGAALAATPTYVEWIRVAPSQPRTVWVGGELGCDSATTDGINSCPGWALRSLDGGKTWFDASAPLARADGDFGAGQGCSYTRTPAVLDPMGRQIAIEEDGGCVTASSTYQIVLYSRDAGSHWTAMSGNQGGGYGAGASVPAFSFLPPYTLWLADTSANGDTIDAAWFKNGSLHDGDNPSAATTDNTGNDQIQSLVPDPRSAGGVFANADSYVAFSPKDGSNWRWVTAPPKVTYFSVSRDPAVRGGLVATSQDKRFPPDRRWYSTNGGTTWTAGVCAGAYKGVCPRATVAGAGGSAPALAFNHAGVWTYLGHAGASGKASVTLPVAPARVLDAGGQLGAAEPLYILSSGTRGAVHGVLYRSLDGGRTWIRITLPAPVLK